MTRKVTTIADMKRIIRRWKRSGKSIGLVPTMGALHDGHLSLVRRSVAENDRTVVWIFVNPTQFGRAEDLAEYPRSLTRDVRLCKALKVNVVFAPTVEEVYPDGFATCVEVAGITRVLCGRSRPRHFRGVTTVCAKMFGMVEPDRAYFGEKDYQQLIVVRRMVDDLNMDVEIVGCPIVREKDGLALSSRNKYLGRDQRKQALVLSRSLTEARRLIESEGVTDTAKLKRAIRRIIRGAPSAKIDYVEIVHPTTLASVKSATGNVVIALAVFIGGTRLIDNTKAGGQG